MAIRMFPKCWLLAGVLLCAPVRAAPEPFTETLPIDLNASFSELDRLNNRLIFRALTVRQGGMSIKADQAIANPADFDNSLWIFTGHVVFNNEGTKATCDRAEMTFRDSGLRQAVLTGKPARFSQAGIGNKPTVEGRGNSVV